MESILEVLEPLWIKFFEKKFLGLKKFFGPPSQRKQAKKTQKLLKMGFWSPEMPFNVCVGLQNCNILLENVDFYNKNAK